MRRLALASVLVASPALAHVELDAPNGGETLVIGESYEVVWSVLIQHDTINWDLFYSVESDNGPWEPIALDLPPGDIGPGAVHSFDWLVPDTPADEAWVRVVMDNTGFDYEDVSDAPFSIVPAPATGALLAPAALALTRRRR
jgi:hypothetical protein